MSIGDANGNALTIQDLPNFTEQYRTLFIRLSKQTNMHIIAGTHVLKKGDNLVQRRPHVLPRRQFVEQAKLHITPTEVHEWNMQPGDPSKSSKPEKGTVALLTCYDIEFPEIVRMAKAKEQTSSSAHPAPTTDTDSTACATPAMPAPSRTKSTSY